MEFQPTCNGDQVRGEEGGLEEVEQDQHQLLLIGHLHHHITPLTAGRGQDLPSTCTVHVYRVSRPTKLVPRP